MAITAGRDARLVHAHHVEPAEPPRHPVEGMLSLTLLLARRAIGEELAPRAVCFVHPRPGRVTEHARIFGAPVHFGRARNELVLDRGLLDRRQRRADTPLLAMLSRQLDGQLSAEPPADQFLACVRRSMMDDLPDREPTIASVAARQHMSPRTLQRRLQDEGTRFATVLAELRRELALRYLRDPRIAIGEVGFLLGFRDIATFHRAFKRWTGATPSGYRRDAAA